MGGTDVRTQQEADVYVRLLRQPVEIGEHLEEPACMSERDPRWQAAIAEGRECPRIDLDRDNEAPYDLLLLAASEHTRPLFEPYFRALCGHLPAEERANVLRRVHAGLMSEPIVAKLFPKPKKDN